MGIECFIKNWKGQRLFWWMIHSSWAKLKTFLLGFDWLALTDRKDFLLPSKSSARVDLFAKKKLKIYIKYICESRKIIFLQSYGKNKNRNYRKITVYECTFSFNWKRLRVALITTQDERILYNKIINNMTWFWHMIQLIFQMSFCLGGDDWSLLQLAHFIYCVPSVTSDPQTLRILDCLI